MEELDSVTEFHEKDLFKEQLKMQLDMAINIPPRTDEHDLPSLLKQLKEMSATQRSLFCQVFILTSLILVMPATNAVSERSFNTLRRIKTYLRSTIVNYNLTV